MIEEALRSAIESAPRLGLYVFTVYLFLRHLKSRDEMLKTIGDNCHEVMNLSTTAITKNTEAYGRVTAMLDRVDTTLRKVNGG